MRFVLNNDKRSISVAELRQTPRYFKIETRGKVNLLHITEFRTHLRVLNISIIQSFAGLDFELSNHGAYYFKKILFTDWTCRRSLKLSETTLMENIVLILWKKCPKPLGTPKGAGHSKRGGVDAKLSHIIVFHFAAVFFALRRCFSFCLLGFRPNSRSPSSHSQGKEIVYEIGTRTTRIKLMASW